MCTAGISALLYSLASQGIFRFAELDDESIVIAHVYVDVRTRANMILVNKVPGSKPTVNYGPRGYLQWDPSQ